LFFHCQIDFTSSWRGREGEREGGNTIDSRSLAAGWCNEASLDGSGSSVMRFCIHMLAFGMISVSYLLRTCGSAALQYTF
jgi:hypothetical protein